MTSADLKWPLTSKGNNKDNLINKVDPHTKLPNTVNPNSTLSVNTFTRFSDLCRAQTTFSFYVENYRIPVLNNVAPLTIYPSVTFTMFWYFDLCWPLNDLWSNRVDLLYKDLHNKYHINPCFSFCFQCFQTLTSGHLLKWPFTSEENNVVLVWIHITSMT